MSAAAVPVPPELKHVLKFLQQAKKTDRHMPLAAYYCRLHAVTLAMSVPNKTKEVKMFLASLLTQMEAADPALKEMEKEDAKKQIEKFVLLVFKRGDDEDRAGTAKKSTVHAFHTAYVIMEVLKHFGPLSDEVAEMSKYAQWKAADIAKALREGRTPTPGPPGGLGEEDTSTPSSAPDADGMQPFGQTPSGGPGGFAPGGGGQGPGGFAPGGGGQGPGAYEGSVNPPEPSPSPPVDAFGLPEIPSGPTRSTPADSQPSFPNISQPGPSPNPNPNPNPMYQPKPANNYQPSNFLPPRDQHQQPHPSSVSHGFSNEQKVATVAKAEKLTKHALSAMRFTDVDTSISKLQDVIQLLRPFSTRYR